MPRKPQRTFQELWVYYITHDSGNEEELLTSALSAATGYTEARQVFLAATTGRTSTDSGEFLAVHMKALRKMIRFVATQEEARDLLKLAGKKKVNKRPFYPARYREAVAKAKTLGVEV